LTGSVPDQSVLYGLLNRLSDLGIQLSSVTSTVQNQTSHPESDEECHQ
jgi:hypothetical protein